MGKNTSTPAAPDPNQTTSAQSGLERGNASFNAALNRYNVNSPFGSLTWQQTGTDPKTGAPIYGQNISLNPDAQQAVTNSQRAQAGISGVAQQAAGQLSANPFSNVPAAPVNAGMTAQQAIMSRLQPQINLQNQQFEADMANRGIAQGSDPYVQARRSLANQQNDQTTQAALYGINTDMQARQNEFQNSMAPLQYINGLMNASQVQTPQFQGTPSIMSNAPNYQNAVNAGYQGQLNSYNAQTGANNSMMSGLFGLGAATAPYWGPALSAAIA